MACATIYGSQCFTAYPKYTAIAALTNLLATPIGCLIQVLFLSDTARLLVNLPPQERMMVDEHLHSRAAERVAGPGGAGGGGFQGGGVSIRQLTRDSGMLKQ